MVNQYLWDFNIVIRRDTRSSGGNASKCDSSSYLKEPQEVVVPSVINQIPAFHTIIQSNLLQNQYSTDYFRSLYFYISIFFVGTFVIKAYISCTLPYLTSFFSRILLFLLLPFVWGVTVWGFVQDNE